MNRFKLCYIKKYPGGRVDEIEYESLGAPKSPKPPGIENSR